MSRLVPKLRPIFMGVSRYRGAYGGRGSGKTKGFAKMACVVALRYAALKVSGVILCGRKFMNSLEDSSLEEIKDAIRNDPELEPHFDVGEKYVRTKCKRVKFIFAGLNSNINSIKSKSNILVTWIDEAEDVSELAWRKLLPTVRSEGAVKLRDGRVVRWRSEVWITWNPEREDSATNVRFRQNADPEIMKITEVNFGDNPYFPDVLELERQQDEKNLDPELYHHIWFGGYLENGQRQVLGGKWFVGEMSEEDRADATGPYYGMDFGHNDPTTIVECYIANDKLFVTRAMGRSRWQLSSIPADAMEYFGPSIERATIHGDSAATQSIHQVRASGLSGLISVSKIDLDADIRFLRSFKAIVVHPSCTDVQYECKNYEYKVDKNTDEVTDQIVDKHNHYIDAIRYAVSRVRQKNGIYFRSGK